jgi:hypothetical protein
MIKNYTSSVAAARSVAHIEAVLAAHGAQSVLKQYDPETRKLIAVSFFMQIGHKLIPFRLPARADQVFILFRNAMKRTTPGILEKAQEQAERTAWKIISDWVDAQMALVDLQQAEIAEIFMPYMWNDKLGKSLYQIAQDKGFNMLEAPRS